jgi:hypothetical protein
MPKTTNKKARMARSITCPSFALPVPAKACPLERMNIRRSKQKMKILSAFMV